MSVDQLQQQQQPRCIYSNHQTQLKGKRNIVVVVNVDVCLNSVLTNSTTTS